MPKDARFDVVGQLDSLRKYARALTRDADEAEDLVHDALLRAYQGRRQFRAGHSLKAWLLSVLHNAFVDGIRKRRAEARRLAHVAEIAPREVPPSQDHAVRLAQVRAAFLELPDSQRAVLHLIVIEGLSYQEAAATLGIPLGTLMSRLGRARAALRSGEEPSAAAPEQPFPRSTRLRVVGGSDDPAA